jgi:hypothetical protein
MFSSARVLGYKLLKWSTVVSPLMAGYNCVLPIIVLLCLLDFGGIWHLTNIGFGVVIKQYLSLLHLQACV